jgi:hypothetical protein
MENKCAHPTCNCPAAQGEKYCSTYCQDAGDLTEIACNCGHRGCVEQAVAGPDVADKIAS